MTALIAALTGALLFVAACGGSQRHIAETVGKNPVIFESDDAERTFADEVSDRYDGRQVSRNTYYNREVESADSDGDGIITDQEASSYADE